MIDKHPCVYLLTNKPFGTLYLGVTSDLRKRVWQHKEKSVKGFTKRYAVDKLVWYEQCDSIYSAISREKNIKNWKRDWKIQLVLETNASWRELYEGVF